MDQQQNNSGGQGQPAQPRGPIHAGGVSAPPPPPQYMPMPYAPPAKRSFGTMAIMYLLVVLLLASLVANLYLGLFFYASVSNDRLTESTYFDGDVARRIVILPIGGIIDDSKAWFVDSALRQLDNDPPAALVLRIQSGGGGVTASDQIWSDLKRFKDKHDIPIVASFGGVAASGGYYVAADADFIMAEETCITGSIGVMAQAFTIEELLDKVGVTPEVLVASKSHEKDVANNIFRAWTEEDRAVFHGVLDHAYDRFATVVDEGRDQLDRAEVEKLATGQIFTAEQAKNEKLIDGIGYVEDAIAKAKDLAGIPAADEVLVTYIHVPVPLLSMVLGERQRGMDMLQTDGSFDPEQVRRWATELTSPRLEYRFDPRAVQSP